MSANQLLAQARTVLLGNLSMGHGDEILIVWDETVSADLVEALRCAAILADIRPYLFVYSPLQYRPMAEVGLFAGASLLPDGTVMPPALGLALRSCPVVALVTSDMEMMSMFSPAFREILAGGTRVAALSYLTTESAIRLLPDGLEEVASLSELTNRGAALLAGGRDVRVTSPAGTDITLRVGQYKGRSSDGVIAPGQRQLLPAGQVTRVPNDGTANGTLVVDRSIAANDFRPLRDAVTFTVEDGYVTKIEGALEAANLRHWLASQDNHEIYHVTELAFGTNSRCRQAGVAAPCEDTHTAGCVSFALGADVHIGGSTRAPAHIDMTMRQATLELDGTALVKDGTLNYM
jgi:2,5-dihydroxypyridine 5,6-dioxygenase